MFSRGRSQIFSELLAGKGQYIDWCSKLAAKCFNRRIKGDAFLKCIVRQEAKMKQYEYFTTRNWNDELEIKITNNCESKTVCFKLNILLMRYWTDRTPTENTGQPNWLVYHNVFKTFISGLSRMVNITYQAVSSQLFYG